MQEYLQQFVDFVLKFREVVGGFIAPRLYIFELSSLVISAVLLWGCIFAATRSDFFNKKFEDWMDYLGYGDVGKRRQLRAWRKIVKKMRSEDPMQWKVAILETDKIFDDMIRAAGFRATVTDERFKQITPEFVANFDEIIAAHKTRNRCAQEPDFMLTKEEAIQTLRAYKKAFQEFGLLD